ncbi:MAG TPA: phosphatase PAP2 family protein [Myxococcaceae bacterium]|nr:phosphatase PAP2 family protein [Myxococcaceae bacterium]
MVTEKKYSQVLNLPILFTFDTCLPPGLVMMQTDDLRREQCMVRQLLRFDEAVLLGMCRWRPRSLTLAMRALTRCGDASTWIVVALVLLAAGGQARRCGLLLGSAALIATILSQGLKRTCRRARPSSCIGGFTALMENPDAFSFPSGHTAAASAVAIALAGQGWLGPFHLGLALAIATSRVYLGAHYPLDTAAGGALGLIAGLLARALF